MTRQTTEDFLKDLGLYSKENVKRYRDGWTITEIKNGFQFAIMKKDFYNDLEGYQDFINHINKYQ